MNSGPLFTDAKKDVSDDAEISNGDDKKLLKIIEDYKDLLENQADERKQLLAQVDSLSQRTEHIELLDSKIEHLVVLLSDIREQISALSSTKSSIQHQKPMKDISVISEDNGTLENKQGTNINKVPSPLIEGLNVVASKGEIKNFSEELDEKSSSLDKDIETLTELLDNKTIEIQQKDSYIDELNIKLEGTSDEKERLISQLESLNSTINSWQGQLNLLQRLAASDPRYKLIGALKKHGSLSDIQLAFTMGTSISQVRKYIDDLSELELVKKDNSGRYIWIGQDIENQLNT